MLRSKNLLIVTIFICNVFIIIVINFDGIQLTSTITILGVHQVAISIIWLSISINYKWQSEWENSTFKPRYIKPYIEEWESAHNGFTQCEIKIRDQIKYWTL